MSNSYECKASVEPGLACRLRSFVHRSDGAAAVEFSMVALPFFFVVFAILESAFNGWATNSLDLAMRKATRQIQVGTAQSAGMTVDEFRSSVCKYLPSFLQCSSLAVDVQAVDLDEFDDFLNKSTITRKKLAIVDLIRPSMDQNENRFCLGEGGDYMVARAIFAVPNIAGFTISNVTMVNGKKVHFVESAQAFRNEPFSGKSPC